jgi:hypothetical protein
MSRRNLAVSFIAGLTTCVGLALAGVWWNHHSPEPPSPDAGPEFVAGAYVSSSLSEPDRTYIWETERTAFQLNHLVAPQLTAAIEREDRAELLAFLSDEFRGTVFEPGSAETVRRSFGEFFFQTATKQTPLPVGRDEFVDWLLQHAKPFRSTRQAQLSLLYLNPVRREAMDAAWIGTWTLRIYGELGDGGPQPETNTTDRRAYFPARNSIGNNPLGEVVIRGRIRWDQTPADFEHDRAWIASWEIEQATTARATHALMEDVTAQSGIDVALLRDNWRLDRKEWAVGMGGVYACDYNNDGKTDLLLTEQGTVKLYAGLGDAKFEDVTFASGLQWEELRGVMAVLADFDNDGDEDLILTGTIFENHNGQFLKRGSLQLDKQPVGGTVADYDGDGLVDVYLSYAAPGPQAGAGRTSWVDDRSGVPNKLFRNSGSFRFEDTTESAGAGAGTRSTFTSVWLDADDDGWPDIYVINELGANLLLRNEHNGTFSEIHVGPEFDGFTMGAAAGDVDGDGRIDLYLGNMYSKAGQRIVANVPVDAYPAALREKMRRFVSGNSLLLNRGNNEFGEVDAGVAAVGWAYGPALVDLDGDGLLDIHATCGFASFSRHEPDG